MDGLDLFTGIGLLAYALKPWVVPIGYCEIDVYCRHVLLQRMRDGLLPVAPICTDVRAIDPVDLPVLPDIISGGFPCQDISLAGNGAGLGGERSGLFFEIARLVGDIRPRFVFLENVPAIRTRGADVLAGRLASLGYDCRWGVLSAFDVGAPHLRERWWLLAHRNGDGLQGQPQRFRFEESWSEQEQSPALVGSETLDDPLRFRLGSPEGQIRSGRDRPECAGWWAAEPALGRVVDGCPYRVEQLRALGNAVVWQCAREAFRRLSGL